MIPPLLRTEGIPSNRRAWPRRGEVDEAPGLPGEPILLRGPVEATLAGEADLQRKGAEPAGPGSARRLD